MSHNNVYSKKILDIFSLIELCQEQNIQYEYQEGTVFAKRLYAKEEVNAIATFKLDKWNYPCIITPEGDLVYDNFGGHWGSMEVLGEFTQQYNKKATEKEIDYTAWDNVQFNTLENGDIQIEMIEY